MNIYYIGNGFDLAHNLRTNYLDFKHYLKVNQPDYYEKFIEMYGLRSNVYVDHFNEELIYDEDDEEIIKLWKDFENTLAKIDPFFIENKVYERLNAYDLTETEFEGIFDPDLKWKQEIYINNMNLYELYEPLQNAFISWINSIEKTQTAQKPKYRPKPLYPINASDSVFVVFNYTHTLQKVYDVDDIDICYPHGEANSNWMPPVFGHGSKDALEEILDYSLEEDDSYVIEWFKEYLMQTKKPVESLMNRVEHFLERIPKDDVKIKIIGLSFSEVDTPYFIQANKMFPTANWEISYYSKEDKVRIEKLINELGICNSRVKIICTEP